VRGMRFGRGQVHYSAEVEDHESHKAAFAASEVTSLESSHARIIRDNTAGPTTNVPDSETTTMSRCCKQLTLEH
jgi:hypothetical protein